MNAQPHPLVQQYLDAIDRRLTAPPAERATILEDISSHIHERLSEGGTPASDDAVRTVLNELGSPEAVAAEWADQRPRPAGGMSASPAVSTEPRSNLPKIALGFGILAVVGIIFPPIAIIAGVVALITGIIALRGSTTDSDRNLSWTAILCGGVVASLTIVALIGLTAFTTNFNEDSGTSVGMVTQQR